MNTGIQGEVDEDSRDNLNTIEVSEGKDKKLDQPLVGQKSEQFSVLRELRNGRTFLNLVCVVVTF